MSDHNKSFEDGLRASLRRDLGSLRAHNDTGARVERRTGGPRRLSLLGPSLAATGIVGLALVLAVWGRSFARPTSGAHGGLPATMCLEPAWHDVYDQPFGGSGPTLYAVAALSPSNVWAVGGEMLSVDGSVASQPHPRREYILHWDGSQWLSVAGAARQAGGAVLRAVSAVSPTDVWAVGEQVAPGAPAASSSAQLGQALIEHWNGAAWTLVASPSTGVYSSQLRGVWAASASEAWAVGSYRDNAQGPPRMLILHWDGRSWTVAPGLPNVGGNNASEAMAVTGKDGAVWVAGDSYPVAAASSQAIGLARSLVWRLSSGTWIDVSPRRERAADTWATPGPHAWTPAEYPGGDLLRAISVVNPQGYWAAGAYAEKGGSVPLALKSNDTHLHGPFWQEPGLNADGPSRLNAVKAFADNDVWVAGYEWDHGDSGPLLSHWTGQAWATYYGKGPMDATLRGMAATSSTDIWAVGGNVSADINGQGGALILHYRCSHNPTPTLTELAMATPTTTPPIGLTPTIGPGPTVVSAPDSDPIHLAIGGYYTNRRSEAMQANDCGLLTPIVVQGSPIQRYYCARIGANQAAGVVSCVYLNYLIWGQETILSGGDEAYFAVAREDTSYDEPATGRCAGPNPPTGARNVSLNQWRLIDYSLHLVNGQWLVYDQTPVQDQRPLSGQPSRTPVLADVVLPSM